MVHYQIHLCPFEEDDDDPYRQMFYENWLCSDLEESERFEVSSSKYGESTSPVVVGASAEVVSITGDSCSDDENKEVSGEELPPGLWLMDTGCGFDLISRAGADGLQTQTVDKITFQTAGGRVHTSDVLPIASSMLGGSLQPYVLPSTPWVLSIGKRCMEQAPCVVCVEEGDFHSAS